MQIARDAATPLLVALAFALLSISGAAQVVRQEGGAVSARAYVSPRLRTAVPLDAVPVALALEGASWRGLADRRTGRIVSAEGTGIPWRLQKPDLAGLERAARAFLPQVETVLGVDASSLVLNRDRSGLVGGHLWNVDFDVVTGGLPVEGARVVFRVSHGNLIQMGSESLPEPGAAVPEARISRQDALAVLAGHLDGFSASDTFLDGGSLHLLPQGILVWQHSFQRKGEPGTWRARIDATTGELLELRDVNVYGRVTGGVFPESPTAGAETVLPMPFAQLSSGTVTDPAGWFEPETGPVSSSLSGPYVRIRDWCGTVSQGSDWSGDVTFGASPGTDCATPGGGGPGNTHAARTQFFHVNRAKEAARVWLPDNAWLDRRLTVNVNLSSTCNAYWDGTEIAFFRSGGGCRNTGEIAAVALHEYGHGLDSNDGNGLSPDLGTAEAYGDFTAALATRSSCIGPGFLSGPCGGYGDACTECTGVRDLDWAKRASGAPHTVENFTRLRCPVKSSYAGPCGREGHCESYVASEALWDLAARDLPGAGTAEAWAVAERLWYLSRSTATAAFSCNTSDPAWTSSGCGIGSLWKTMRAVDDDDGDLSNGTPHSCHLFAAFDRHGIACPDDPGADVCSSSCSPPAAQEISLVPDERRIDAIWTASSGLVYDVYRAEGGCGAAFRKVADDLASATYSDAEVVPGTVYAYRMLAHAENREACSSPLGPCAAAVPEERPCSPPAAPAGLSAAADGLSRVGLAWSPVPGVQGYNVYRSAVRVASLSASASSWTDSGLSGGSSYEYRVRAHAGGCESASSPAAKVSTDPCSRTLLFSDDFESGSGLGGWTAHTVLFNGDTEDWRGRQACPARSGSRVMRFGGPGCSASYDNHQFAYVQPGGAAGLEIPADSTGTRLSFWHRRDFEALFDGAVLLLSVDGGPQVPVPATALSGAVYDGTVAHVCPPATAVGLSVFTGARSAFEETVVDLDAACDKATGGTDGCAGRALFLGFAGLSDCSGGGSGWSLDDVAVTACAALPPPLDFHTVAPCRLVDRLLPGVPLSLSLTGACGVPATARALAVNVTVADPLLGGSLTLTGAGEIPFEARRTRALHTLLALPTDGSGIVQGSASSPFHLLVDVTGYFQ